MIAALSAQNDPLTSATEVFNGISSYSVTINSKGSGDSEKIRYYFKKPGYIRMEFVEPHKGALLVYNPVTRRVRLRPFDFFKSFVLDLSPSDRLIRSSMGHTVDESDIGSLLRNIGMLRVDGHTEFLGEETLGEREAVALLVRGGGQKAVKGVNSYEVWLDKATSLPVKVKSYDQEGVLLEDVDMTDLEVDAELPDGFFSID